MIDRDRYGRQVAHILLDGRHINREMIREGHADPEAMEQQRLSLVPLGRLGTVDDIAYGVLYLASDEAAFVTGSELVIDGGFIAQ